MTWEHHSAGDGAMLRMRGELTIYTAREVAACWLEAMAAHDELEIDLSEVTDIDTAGLQLMLAAKRMPGKTLRFVGHGAPVLRLIELANVGHTLGDPLVLAA